MGSTFSSIHVIDADFDIIERGLCNYQLEGKKTIENSKTLQNELGYIEKEKNKFIQAAKLMKFLFNNKPMPVQFYCKKQNKFISVFSDFLKFETVDDIAREYFADFDNYVVSIGVLDSDVFSLSIYQKGDLVDNMMLGENLEVFGYSEKTLKSKKAIKLLNFNDEQLQALMVMKDADEITAYISEYLGLQIDPINVDLNDKDVKKVAF